MLTTVNREPMIMIERITKITWVAHGVKRAGVELSCSATPGPKLRDIFQLGLVAAYVSNEHTDVKKFVATIKNSIINVWLLCFHSLTSAALVALL
jgi:hypothetical protein